VVKRWVFWSSVGVLFVVVMIVAALTGSSGGHRSHDVAGRKAVSPTPTVTPSPVMTPTPTPKSKRNGGSSRRHAIVSHSSMTSRRGAARSSVGRSGAGQADPCAHNHHCYVPPMPPVKPDPDPPVPRPTLTITGAPVAPPSGG
jgi:hypothetical protein